MTSRSPEWISVGNLGDRKARGCVSPGPGAGAELSQQTLSLAEGPLGGTTEAWGLGHLYKPKKGHPPRGPCLGRRIC